MTIDTGTVGTGTNEPTWSAAATEAVRRLGSTTAAGALLGLLVGGVGGRLVMFLLVRLNPEATGVRSDDDFVMGQFTVSGTFSLLLVGTVFGAIGGGIYTLLRPLLIGPRWFQVLSISLGPAVVVGEELVHVSGVDFQLLHPTWLSVLVFLMIPGVYAALLTLLAERWRPPQGPFGRKPWPVALIPLVLSGPGALLLAGLAVSWVVLEYLRRNNNGTVPFAVPAAWLGRAGLTVVFVVSLVNLVDEVSQIV